MSDFDHYYMLWSDQVLMISVAKHNNDKIGCFSPNIYWSRPIFLQLIARPINMGSIYPILYQTLSQKKKSFQALWIIKNQTLSKKYVLNPIFPLKALSFIFNTRRIPLKKKELASTCDLYKQINGHRNS